MNLSFLKSARHVWLLLAVLLATMVSSCGNSQEFPFFGSPNTGPGPGPSPGAAPTVVYVSPDNGEPEAPINGKVLAIFSEPMNATTLTAATFTLTGNNGTPVTGTVTSFGRAAIFDPASNLTPGTVYTATITTGAQGQTGNALAAPYQWTFTTLPLDNTPPTVTFTDPVSGAENVPLNHRLAITFSEAMDPASLTDSTITLAGPNGLLTGTVDDLGLTTTFTPSANLQANTAYTATVSTGARDLSGNALSQPFVWTFTTGTSADSGRPTVTFTDPTNGEQNVAVNRRILATFSETMEPSTVISNFRLSGPNNANVVGTVTYVGLVATFTPLVPLANNTLYTARVTTGARDLANNSLAQDFTWSFTTGSQADATAPTVTFTDPVNGEVNVGFNRSILATFSEAMNPESVNVSFTLTSSPGSAPVIGTVTYAGLVATYKPLTALAPNTLYTATVTTGAKDLAGNPLAANFQWTFTTGATPDATAPTVTSTDPVNGATGVATNKVIAANFSEAMQPLTNLTFTVSGPGGNIVGTVGNVGQVATFTPLAPLSNSTTYTATITTGAKDLAGNSLAASTVWTFTTSAAPDLGSPTVTSTRPANLATNVGSNDITATFSEGMDPLSLTTVTFLVRNVDLDTAVVGIVTYDVATRTAKFVPTVNLLPNTNYRATITTGARDLALNPMLANYVWTFKTSVAILGAMEPFGGFGGNAGMTNAGTLTRITGDIGTTAVSTSMTGFQDRNGDGDSYTVTGPNRGIVTGTIFADGPPPGTAAKAALAARALGDAIAAHGQLRALLTAPGVIVLSGDLAGVTLAPGVYSSTGVMTISNGNLTLDAGGDSNATFIFLPTALTTNAGNVLLTNGAQSKNVYWALSAGSQGTINNSGLGEMVGTVIGPAGVTFVNGKLNGRAIGFTASVTMVNTIINIPTP